MLALLLSAATLAPIPTPVDPPTWQIDASHSELSFRVRHFVTKVPGTFGTWKGSITADPAGLAGGSVEVEIDARSVDTRNERRDNDLRSSRFFAVDSSPTITFKSTRVEVSGSSLTVTGDLSIKGVTKSVVLRGEYLGTSGPAEPRRQRIGFAASTRINRLDFGVSWNRVVEGGGMMLGDEVEITINIEAVRTS
jgi:polyisoprenoid-binding protein YceI